MRPGPPQRPRQHDDLVPADRRGTGVGQESREARRRRSRGLVAVAGQQGLGGEQFVVCRRVHRAARVGDRGQRVGSVQGVPVDQGLTLPGDISASDRYYATDITEPSVLRDGHLAVPSGPGLGVAPLPAVMAEVTTAVSELRRG